MTNHPLVPNFIVEQDALGKREGTLLAATQFVDISGFTSLTEKLMTQGKEGAELLASTLQLRFNPLVEAVEAAGGFITGFAGDAFTAVYPVLEDHNPAAHVLRASWLMQDFFSKHGLVQNQFGSFSFAVKIGLSWGEVDWKIIDSSAYTPTYYFCGEGIDGCADAEKYCEKGFTVMDTAFRAQVQEAAVEPLEDGYFRYNASAPEKLPDLSPTTPAHDAPTTDSRFVHPSIANFPQSGEFRRVAVVFLSFKETDNLQEFSDILHTELDRFGGTFTRFDFGDKGGNILMFFGAPTSHENDEERALDFVIRVMNQLRDRIPLRGGVTQNIMYAGFNGGVKRHEFACLGKAVSLAARLMVKADWGEIWCDPKIYTRTSRYFDFGSLGKHKLKGFADPVPLYLLKNRLSDSQVNFTAVAMIGREEELNLLTSGISRIFQQEFAGVFYIDGEPGMGKSYLVASSRSIIGDPHSQLSCRWVYAPTNQTLQGSLHPYAHALRAYTNQSPSQDSQQNRQAFESALTALKEELPESQQELRKELERVHSFLAALVGIRIPDSLYEQLEPRLRFSNTIRAISSWLQALCTLSPVVLQLEDGHWLDDASIQATLQLLQDLKQHPLAVILTCRYLDGGQPFRLPLEEDIHHEIINLNQLSRHGLNAMALAQLGDDAADSLLDLLEEKAHGNPFFVEQILRFLQDQHALESTPDGLAPAATGFILPEEVNTVLVARLDRLERNVKDVVQVASVLGREFEGPILSHIVEDTRQVSTCLQTGEEEQIWTTLRPQQYFFIHALMRDAAYDMQARARLRELHERAGRAYENETDHQKSSRLRELAYHFEQANLIDKAMLYLEKAGDEAREDYRNQEALEFYTRLAKYIPAEGESTRRVYLSTAQVMQVLGKIEDGLQLCELAESATAIPSPQVRYQKAFLTQMQGKFDEARALIGEAIEIAKDQEDHEWEARCLNSLGVLSLYRGDIDDAEQKLQQSLAIAKRAQQPPIEVKAISNMAGVAMARKDLQGAREYLSQSLQLARELKDRWTEFLSLGNLGDLFLQLERPSEALECLEESKHTGEQIGTQNAAFLAHYGEALRQLNRHAEATTIIAQAETLARGSKNAKHIINVLLVKGRTMLDQDQTTDAKDAFEEAITLAQQSKQQALLDKAQNALAQLPPS